MTKRTLGISLYPDHSDVNEDKKYLKMASEYGFTKIFMSMLEVSEGKERVTDKFSDLIQYAKRYGFSTTLDIAPNIFDQLGVSYDDLSFFHDLGADTIRLDQGFDGQKEALISFNPQKINIELNMSNDVEYLNNILSYKANKPFIQGCHNFYPQRGTGLPLDFFIKSSKRFKDMGIDTAAFINSQSGRIGPWDINDGLPTLEMHRDLPIDVQAKHLFATGLIDCVIVGNAYASETELSQLGMVNRYQLAFDIDLVDDINELEEEILFDNQHVRRGDITDLVIRSTQVRKRYRDYDNPVSINTHNFKPGDVVIGNNSFGKYKNELQIVLKAHTDIRKNKVAEITQKELFLLNYIGPWDKFKFGR